MTDETVKTSFLNRMLERLERAGNKLPDPVSLFIIIIVLIVGASALLSYYNVSVVNPATNKTVHAVSLLTKESLQKMLMSVVTNFQGFPPLGLVLVTMLGVGVAEKTGLMEAAMKNSVARVSPKLVTLIIILVGLNGNATGDAAIIILPPLAASIYYGLGRNPLAGMFTAYASVVAAFHANLMVNLTDVLETSFTIPAAQIIMPDYISSPAMNYYFIAASVGILLVIAFFVSEKIIEPRLGTYEAPESIRLEHIETEDNPNEMKGLKWAGISVLIFVIILVALCIGEDSFMRDPKTHELLSGHSPLMKGLVPIVFLFFLIPGTIYGAIVGTIKSDRDLVHMMNQSMSGMGGYIVLAFVAAQFLMYFKWSNMGLIIAISGADALHNAGITGIGLIVGFILLSCLINMFIGSASAKWAIMAPVFVPMFLLLGYDPALTQMAYRIGDSITNAISPLFPYFPIIIAFAEKYNPKAGMGTIIANMLPFTVAFGIFWTILLIIFIMFNIPLGPDGGIYMVIH